MNVKPHTRRKWATLGAAAIALLSIGAAPQKAEGQAPDLSQLQYLVGDWTITGGRMTLYGASPRGETEITSELNGRAYFVRDSFTLIGVEGQDLGKNDSVMLIYQDGTILRADFSNGRGALHYRGSISANAKSVVFESEPPQGAATYRFTYKQESPDTLTWTLEFKRADAATFGLLQTETLVRKK